MPTKIPKLFELLKERGVSAKKLSDNTGISTGNISDWKSGRAKPSSEKLTILATYFNVSTDYLLGNDTSETKDPATEEEIKFALFNGSDGITDEMYEEVKNFAAMVKLREEQKKKGKK